MFQFETSGRPEIPEYICYILILFKIFMIFFILTRTLLNLSSKSAGAERDGMDYNDTATVRKQKERIVSKVNEAKDHPAVMIWAIGNEKVLKNILQ